MNTEYTNGETPRYRTLQQWYAHFKFAFKRERPIDSYTRARRALLNRHGYFGYYPLNGQSPRAAV